QTTDPEYFPSALRAIETVVTSETLPEFTAIAQLQGIDVFFHISSEQDSVDATKMTGVVDVGGLGLPTKDYYLSQEETQVKQRADYVAHVSKMLVLSGISQAQADAE